MPFFFALFTVRFSYKRVSFVMYQNHILVAAVLYDMTVLGDLHKIDTYYLTLFYIKYITYSYNLRTTDRSLGK